MKARNALFSEFGVGRWALGVGRLVVQPIEIPAPQFDLEKTLNSGQVFHWEKSGTGFVGTIGEVPAYMEQRGQTLLGKVASASSRCVGEHGQDLRLVEPTARRDAHATVRHYFAFDHPLAEICASLPNDPIMNAARDFCCGLRIIRQPKWECLATFICSSMKQVAHIRQISRALRDRFGQPPSPQRVRSVTDKIGEYFPHTFPSAQRLATSSEKELRECALGYRARNLLLTAQLIASGQIDLEGWSQFSDPDLRARLCELPGVGAKVANCVMLFAYERLRAFPMDVWIERVLREKYFAGKPKPTSERLRAFSENYFGKHGGYAQQYLFHHARTASRANRSRASRAKVRGGSLRQSARIAI